MKMIDSTHVKAPLGGGAEKGEQKQAVVLKGAFSPSS
jgi:hypothetical protein